MIYLKHPEYLYAIIPVTIILFLIIRRDFVKYKDWKEQLLFQKSRRVSRFMVFLSRLVIFSLLIVAAAQPFELIPTTVPGNPSLTILVDKSDSMKLFDNTVSDKIVTEVSKSIPVNQRTIAEGNLSAIGDSILASMQGDDNLLLVTDGNNNYGRTLGDVMLLASSLNTTINSVKLKTKSEDASLLVEGPTETTADTENEFQITVSQTGTLPPYILRVYLDGTKQLEEQITTTKTFSFSAKLKEGYHRIEGEIAASDYFKDNNKFIKTVKVQPKPKILLVSTKESPTAQIYSQIYELTKTTSVPPDISGYSAVILNDQRAEALPVDKLTDYVLDGNGLFIIGGKNSFDKDNFKLPSYKPYEALLPVTVGTGKEEKKKDVNVVLLIDISGSTGGNFNSADTDTVQQVEKAIAVSILKDLKTTDYVGAIAFESVPHQISEMKKLSAQPELENKIKSLAYGKGTDIAAGLSAATDLLSKSHGSKNIILISDGIPGGPAAEDVRVARIAGANGIKLFAVGVGERTNTQHMTEMAAQTGGAYFEPTQKEKIKIILGESEKANDTYSLEIVNNYNFITKNINLKAGVNGYNFVLPKSSAQLLVTTQANEPILTTWRFGLGRIAVMSTDDGSAWNGEMLGRPNSGLITRTTNWVIGDLSRNKDFDVKMNDVYLGEDINIDVISNKQPIAPNLNFTKTGERIYSSTFTPKEIGFYKFFDAVVGVNYQKELSSTGQNSELSKLVSVTRGLVFEPGDTNGIIEKVKTDSKRIKSDSRSYAWILALSAMMLFLAEIAIRKLVESKRINNERHK